MTHNLAVQMVYTVVLSLGDCLMGMSIKEYAKSRSISYESARKQVRRYTKDLAEHTQKIDGSTQLDDFAVEFLDRHRQKRPVIVAPSSEETEQEITNLRAEIDRLKSQLLNVQNQLIDAQKQTIDTQSKYQLLLEQKDTELNTYHKTIFGLYRKD